MALLNQIIAVEKGIKSKSHSDISELYKLVQKPALFNGFSKVYQPKDDDESEKLPSEQHRVQITAADALRQFERAQKDLINITARKDFTNTVASADVAIDGVIVIQDAPVSFLLFLEKVLTDTHAFIKALPVLDEADDWILDPNSGLNKTAAIQTHRTKKVAKPIVLYDATKEHPAQTQVMTEDVIAGYWHQVKHSGAIAKPKKEALLARVDMLHNAIKQAREKANMKAEVDTGDIGRSVFDYIVGKEE